MLFIQKIGLELNLSGTNGRPSYVPSTHLRYVNYAIKGSWKLSSMTMVQFLFYTMLLIYFLEIFPRMSPRKKMLSERFVYTAKTQIEIVANVYLKNAEYDLNSLLYKRLVFF